MDWLQADLGFWIFVAYYCKKPFYFIIPNLLKVEKFGEFSHQTRNDRSSYSRRELTH